MGVFDNFMKRFEDDWCKACKVQMYPIAERLYFMPVTVGHYVEKKDASYYLQKLQPIQDVAQIPVGYYACRIKAYTCGRCGQRIAVVKPFLQVRSEVKEETSIVFRNGEINELLGL